MVYSISSQRRARGVREWLMNDWTVEVPDEPPFSGFRYKIITRLRFLICHQTRRSDPKFRQRCMIVWCGISVEHLGWILFGGYRQVGSSHLLFSDLHRWKQMLRSDKTVGRGQTMSRLFLGISGSIHAKQRWISMKMKYLYCVCETSPGTWSVGRGWLRWVEGDRQLFQFTKICDGRKLTVNFSGIWICVSFSIPIPIILNWYRSNQVFIDYLDQYHNLNIYSSSTKYSIPTRKSYTSDKRSTREAHQDTSFSFDKSVRRCNENPNYAPWEWFGIRYGLYSKLDYIANLSPRSSILNVKNLSRNMRRRLWTCELKCGSQESNWMAADQRVWVDDNPGRDNQNVVRNVKKPIGRSNSREEMVSMN
jgi:hypothetical protein